MGKKAGGTRAAKAAGSVDKDEDASIMKGLEDLFKTMPPNKRNELNGIVEKLLVVCSNFVADEPAANSAKLLAEHEEIRTLVEKCRAMETQFNMTRRLSSYSRKVHLERFVEWLREAGAQVEGVKANDYGPQGFGLMTTKDLQKGDLVLTIPRKCFMSGETARDSILGNLIDKDPMLQRMPNVALALHLLIEKNSPVSHWEPYINVLPATYNTVLYFSLDQLKLLKGSPAMEDAIRQYKYVARQYAYFYRKFQNTVIRDYFTFDDYRWAVSTVMTRQNQVPCQKDFGETTYTLIPFWDLANHEGSTMDAELSTDYDEDQKAAICLANKSFSAGDQFTIFYGQRSNADLLVHNGFIDVSCGGVNPHDRLDVRLGLSKSDPLAGAKFELLDCLSIPRVGGHFALRPRGSGTELRPFDNTLLAFVRVLCLSTKEDLRCYGAAFDEEPADGDDEAKNVDRTRMLLEDETTPELDKKAFSYIQTRCSLLLRCYPVDTKEEDDLILSQSEAAVAPANDPVRTMCLLLRRGEKKILEGAIEYCLGQLKKMESA